MKKIILTILVIILVLSITATASMMIPANDNAKENAKAPEKSPVIEDNWDLVRVDFIHYAKPTGQAKASAATCYKLMGVKWASFPVTYVINPTNPQSLTTDFITEKISTAAETWDAATTKELFNNAYTVDSAAQYGVQDYKNSIAFGNYGQSGVIAVTSVWYTRVGKQIVEFDMLFDTDFTWGDATVDPLLMDLENIATHELGHGAGLGDIYSTACSAVTMYGYSNYGDVAKRTLETADVTGLQKMYGV